MFIITSAETGFCIFLVSSLTSFRSSCVMMTSSGDRSSLFPNATSSQQEALRSRILRLTMMPLIDSDTEGLWETQDASDGPLNTEVSQRWRIWFYMWAAPTSERGYLPADNETSSDSPPGQRRETSARHTGRTFCGSDFFKNLGASTSNRSSICDQLFFINIFM